MKQRILSAVLALCLLISFPSAAYASPEELSPEEGGYKREAIYGQDARETAIPTPAEVYAAMTALQSQDKFKEGAEWTNEYP